MHATTVDPQRRLDHPDPRTRPFYDLFARIPDPATRPARIIDLGCGSGNLTAVLAERWPDAHITGLDNSVERLHEASERFAGETAHRGRVDFVHADLADWAPSEPCDMVISNAAIQWVRDHPGRFRRWTRSMSPGGVFAFQVPDNAASAGHAVLRELCESPQWRDRLDVDATRDFEVLDPADYVDELSALGFAVDAWETTYVHVLPQEDPFLGWIKGTGMQPVLAPLADDPTAIEKFLTDYRSRLREAYPMRPYGTLFPFRRVFVVARKGGH